MLESTSSEQAILLAALAILARSTMESIHRFRKSVFSAFTTALYGPSPTSSRREKQSSLVSRKRPLTRDEQLSYSSPIGENRGYVPSKKSRKKSRSDCSESIASVRSSLNVPIEVEDSSAEEGEEDTNVGGVQLQKVVKASAVSEIRVNCRAVSFENQIFNEDDFMSIGFRPWQTTSCLVLRSDTSPTRSPPIAEFSINDKTSLITWKVNSSQQLSSFPSPFMAIFSANRGALVLFPDEAKDVSALHEVVASSISSFKVSTLELTSAEDADGYLSAFPAGAPPRHRPSSSAPRSEKDPDRVLFSYPWGRLTKDPIEVRKADMRRLAPGELLNDVMVDLFLRRLETNIDGTYAAGYSPRAVVLNSLFFTRLNTIPIPEGPPASVASAYKSMSRWTKDVKLFESDLVLVPIHEGLHWSLIAICHLRHLRFQSRSSKDPLHPRPLFLVLDSLRDQGLHDSSRIVEILKAFFAQECRQQSSYSEQPAAAAAVAALVQAKAVQPADLPQQANHVDCGSFVVHYAQDLYGAVRRSLRKGGPFSAAQWRPSRCSPEAMEAFRLDLLDECKAMELDYRLHAPI